MPSERIIIIDFRSPLMPAGFALRHDVFVMEQAVPSDLERDELDDTAVHLVATRDGEVIGTLRIVVTGETAQIGRMAVRASARKGGVGMRLMRRAAEVASQMGVRALTLHAVARERILPSRGLSRRR